MSLLVPVMAAAPAAGWSERDTAVKCSNYPRQATIAIEMDDVPQAYRASLTSAIGAWNGWSGVTGVAVRGVNRPVPAGSIRVAFGTAQEIKKDGVPAYAKMGQKCNTAPGTGGPSNAKLVASTSLLLGASERLNQNVFTHEIGHLLGLGHNDDVAACSSVMKTASDEASQCADSFGPYPDDIAGVASLWQPRSIRGFPANSQIVNPQYRNNDGYLNANEVGTSEWWPIRWREAAADGRANWTFVPDRGNLASGWGWVVNAATGECLKRHRFERTTTGSCSGDGAKWGIGIRPRGSVLRNKEANACLGLVFAEEDITGTALVPCNRIETVLRIAPAPAALAEPSTLSVPAAAQQHIVGWDSGRCITVSNGGRVPGTGLSMWGCEDEYSSGAVFQHWDLRPVPGGYALTVFNLTRDTAPVIDDTDETQLRDTELCAAGSGDSVALAECAPTAAQTWTFAGNGNIRNGATGTCLNVRGGSRQDGAPIILWPCTTDGNAVWSVPGARSLGPVSLATAASTTGAVIGTAPASGGDPDQRVRTVSTRDLSSPKSRLGFSEVPGSHGGYLIRDVETGTCLRWKGRSTQAALDAACNGSDSSYRWAPTVAPSGGMTVQTQFTGECLEQRGGSDIDGAVVGTFTCNGASNQVWRTVPNWQDPPAPTSVDRVDVNLAMFGTASQSSTYSDAITGSAEKAIDGNPASAWTAGSTSHTQSDPYAWWQIDLGDAYPIDTVKLYNRTDCCTERSKDLWVFFSASPFPVDMTPQQLLSVPGVVGYRLTDNTGPTAGVSPPGTYRHVRVQLPGTGFLSLSEVSITERL